ncbi:MAG: 2-oxo acid dehydrogenase subunit E2 [Candidatus Marinimicrobia bacterium]|nr:2-oxo acid dehydrogenase subunit E2 [Candidatus Neomarinimicrobiota bacterium]
MAKEFKLPELGEQVESASVSKILVSEGDQVEPEQPVMELETDKAVTEVPCDSAGIVERIHVKEGEDVKVGQVLLTLKEQAGTDGPDGRAEAEPEAEPEADGKEAAPEQTAAAHAEAEPPAQARKKAPEAEPAEGAKAETADAESDQRAAEGEVEPETQEEDEPRRGSGEPAPAAPSVRRFAREVGADINAVSGSGPHGRISVADVKRHVQSGGSRGGGASVSAQLPDFSPWGETERKPMGAVRRLTAENTARAWSLAPQATQFGKADVTEIEKLRQRFQEDAEQAGGHLSLTVILVKALAGALKKFPRFNASVDGARNEIVYKRYCHIGLAVDTERGLLVPVVRDADRKNVIELAVAVKELTRRARDGKLGADEMRGGSVTITNAGALGGDTFMPIVNWPEVAILGVARARIEPVFHNGQFRPRTLLPLTLSYDHRVIDGADGVRFMQWLVAVIEDPIKMAWAG